MWWLPHPWKQSKSSWIGPLSNLIYLKVFHLCQEGWSRWPLKVLYNPNHSVILWFSFSSWTSLKINLKGRGKEWMSQTILPCRTAGCCIALSTQSNGERWQQSHGQKIPFKVYSSRQPPLRCQGDPRGDFPPIASAAAERDSSEIPAIHHRPWCGSVPQSQYYSQTWGEQGSDSPGLNPDARTKDGDFPSSFQTRT